MKKVKAQGEAEILVLEIAKLLAKHPLPAILAALKMACVRHAKDTLLKDKATNENGDDVLVLLDFSKRIGRLEDSAGLKNKETRDAYIKSGGRLPSRADKARWSKGRDEFTAEDRRKAERDELGDDEEIEDED